MITVPNRAMGKRKVQVEDIAASESIRQRRSTRAIRKIEREDFVYTGPPVKARDEGATEVLLGKPQTAAIVAEEWKDQGSLVVEEVNVDLGEDVMSVIIKEEDPDAVIDADEFMNTAHDAEAKQNAKATSEAEKKPLLQLVKLTDSEIKKWMKNDDQKMKLASPGLLEQYVKPTEDGAVECVLCKERLVPSRGMYHLTTKCTKSPLRTCIMYNCSLCCASFTNHSVFLSHFRLHTKKFLTADSLCCEVCNKINCKGLTEVDLKAAACHPTLVCEICQMVLASAADYVEHKKSHWTGEYGLQCEHCSKMYRNRSDLKYHLRTQHNSTFQYNCVRCGIGLSTRLDVERHQCPTRNPISTAQISVLNRVKLQRLKKNEKEPHTVVVFEDKEKLFVSKDGGKKMFKMEEITSGCDKEVSSDDQGQTQAAEALAGGLDTLADAAAKHQNSCEFCGKTFVTASGRHKHLKLMHGYKRVARTSGPSSCCFCEQIFKSVYHLKEHIRAVHTDDEQFECDVCHKRYRTLKDRNYHKKTVHQGIYRYYCAKCGRGLHSLARLNRHNCNWGQKSKEKAKKIEEKTEKEQMQLQEVADDGKKEMAICRSWNKTRAAESNVHLEVVVTSVNAEKEVTFMMKPSEADS